MCDSRQETLAILLLFFCSLSIAESHASINKYIDEGINYIHNNEDMKHQIDPLHIPDINEPKLRTRETVLTGLSSIQRSGDCILKYENNQTIVEGYFAADNLHIQFHYVAKRLVRLSGKVKLDLSRTSIKISAYFDIYSGKVSLHGLKVVDFGEIKVTKITGFSVLFNGLAKHIINLIIRRSKAKVIRFIENKGTELVAHELEKVVYLQSKI